MMLMALFVFSVTLEGLVSNSFRCNLNAAGVSVTAFDDGDCCGGMGWKSGLSCVCDCGCAGGDGGSCSCI